MGLWLDSAKQHKGWQDGGSLLGGPKRVIWHTTENDPKVTTAKTIVDYLDRVGYQVHVVWNPYTGETWQCIPANRAGRGLRNLAGGVQTNREGGVAVQIEVVGKASKPFTDGPMKGLQPILDWVRGLGVPDVWPGGPPPAGGARHVSNLVWTTKAGHYGHSQTPENDHDDPGGIDVNRLFGHKPNPNEWPGVYYKVGSKGKNVGRIQAAINAAGRKPKLRVDDVFGPKTQTAVKWFQRKKGLDPDGVVGPKTWAEMFPVA